MFHDIKSFNGLLNILLNLLMILIMILNIILYYEIILWKLEGKNGLADMPYQTHSTPDGLFTYFELSPSSCHFLYYPFYIK